MGVFKKNGSKHILINKLKTIKHIINSYEPLHAEW
jgi:hypothetical protein